MTMTLKEIREKYPQYGSKTDQELADAIHNKYYPALPKATVYEKLGLQSSQEPIPSSERTGVMGVLGDIVQGLSGAKQFTLDIPNKLEKSGQYIEQNPATSIFHNIGQLGAATGEIGKGIINAPYDLNQYLASKHLLPEALGRLGKKILPHLPEDLGIEKTLGLEPNREKGDELIRAIPDIAMGLAGGTALIKEGKNLFKAPDLKETIRQTQGKVNEATTETGKIFDTVEKEVEVQGISNIPIDKNIIKQAETYLAKTPANKDLIKRARTGDYTALRELQADLRVKGEKALSSALAAENKMGEEMLSTRDQVNKSIQQHLENEGRIDLAELLNKARDDYRNIQQTYFSTPALAKVFGKSQKVPKNPKTLLTEESTEMNRFMESHPEVKEALSKALKHEKKMKTLGKIGAGLGIGTAAEGARQLFGGK